jgi:dTDP-4-dehydrorhamnose reductase
MNKRILVTGGNGQLAYAIHQIFFHENGDSSQLYAPSHHELDITNQSAVNACIEQYKPDAVINTAAYTQVDKAEQDSKTAFAVNADGAKYLAMACEKHQCSLVHISTDYVFDGKANHHYSETDATSPINVYGKSKLLGEEVIQQYCEKYIILRVSAVFGVHGVNFVKTMLRLAKEKEELRVVSDQITCPTSAEDIARIVINIMERPQWGVFHYCGETIVSWYDFAKKIIETAHDYAKFKVKKIEAIASADYPTLAVRPHYSVLNCEKIKNTFDIKQPQWEAGLNDVIKTLYSA